MAPFIRNFRLLPFAIFVLLAGCSENPTAPDPDVEENDGVYVMTLQLVDPLQEPTIDLGITVGEFSPENVYNTMNYLHRFNNGESVILTGDENVNLIMVVWSGTGMVSSEGIQPSYRFFTDWQAESNVDGIRYETGSRLHFAIDRYPYDQATNHVDWESWHGTQEVRELRSSPAEATVRLPAQSGFAWFVRSTQVRQIGCEGNATTLIRSRNGIITRITNGGPWYPNPTIRQVDTVRVTCTRYESSSAAAMAASQ